MGARARPVLALGVELAARAPARKDPNRRLSRPAAPGRPPRLLLQPACRQFWGRSGRQPKTSPGKQLPFNWCRFI